MTHRSHPLPYWIALAERYFEGLTTEAEEQALRQYLAHSTELHPTLQAARAVMSLAAVARRHRSAICNVPTDGKPEILAPSADFQTGSAKILRGKKKILDGSADFLAPSADCADGNKTIATSRSSRWASLRRVAAAAVVALLAGVSWWSYDHLHPSSVAYVEGQRITNPLLVEQHMQQALRTTLAPDASMPTAHSQLEEAFSTLSSSASSQ